MANEINNITGKNISWDSINSELKKSNASQEQVKTANSIFSKLDTSGDGQIDDEELNKFYGDFKNADTDGDGVISEEEAQKAPENSLLRTFGTKVNGFMNNMKNVVLQNQEKTEAGETPAADDAAATKTNSEQDIPDLASQQFSPTDSTGSNGGLISRAKNLLDNVVSKVKGESQTEAAGTNSTPMESNRTITNGDETTEISEYQEGNYYVLQRSHLNPEDSQGEGNTGNNQYIMADFGDNQYQAGASVTKSRERNGQSSTVSFGISGGKEKGENITGSLSGSRIVEDETGRVLQQNATLTPDKLELINRNKRKVENLSEQPPEVCAADENTPAEQTAQRETTIAANIDIKNLGNGDIKRTVTEEHGNAITTNEQSAEIKDDIVNVAIEQKKDDGNGSVKTKKAESTYDTKTGGVTLDLSNSIADGNGTKSNILHLNSPADDNDIGAKYTHSTDNGSGTVKTQKAESTYNTQTGVVNIDLSNSIVDGNSTKSNILHLNSPADGNDTGAKYTHNSDDGNGNKNETVINGSYGDNGTVLNAKKTTVTVSESPQQKNHAGSGEEEAGTIPADNSDAGGSNVKTVTTHVIEGGYDNGVIKGFNKLTRNLNDGNGADREQVAQYDTNSGQAKVETNKSKTTIVKDESGNTTKLTSENNKDLTYNTRDKSVDLGFTRSSEKQIEGTDGSATKEIANREFRGTYNGTGEAGEVSYKNRIERTITDAEGNERRETVDTSVTGNYKDGEGNFDFSKSKLNSNGRQTASKIGGNISENGKHIGLTFGRTNKAATSGSPAEASAPTDGTNGTPPKVKKDKAFYTSINFDKVSDENGNAESESSYFEDDDYDLSDYSDDDYGEYEYSDDGAETTGKTKTEISASARFRHGNTTIGVDGSSDSQRAGISTHSGSEKGAGTVGAYIENGKDGLNAGTGATYIKRDKNGGLGYAASGNAKINIKTGDTEITGGIAAPVKDKDGNYVGSQKGYAQYNSANKSVTIGGQRNRVFYKKDKTPAAQDTQDTKQELQSPQNLYEFENEELNPEEQTLSSAGNIGEQQEELAGSSTVDEALSQAGQSLENREVAGGYSIKAEVGHASGRNPAVQYNIDAKGFVNTTIGGKDATFYGRVTSTNGQLDEVNGVYGQDLADTVANNTHNAAGSNTKLKKFRDTSFNGADSSEVTNRTSIGMGTVIGNPAKQGANYAGAVNGVFEDGKLTQFTGMGRAEYVYNADENNREAVGAEMSYSMNKNYDTNNFQVKGYYDHTFNDGKTRLGANLGYSMDSSMGGKTQTRFAGFGARQAISSKVDLYGQAEIGQTRGFGSMSGSPENYMAIRTGVQYHLDKKTVVFGEYNTGSGTAMDGSMMSGTPKDKFGAGNFMVGIGMRF